tara:strand:+ start:1815 stop:2348 length:534 start_codon:yes stop_codon:yes gene_type:complete
MACILTSNQGKGCLNAVAGVKKAWIYKHSDVNQASSTIVAGEVTVLTLVAAPSSATPLFAYEFFSETALGEATSTTSKANGTTFWEDTVSFPIAQLNTATQLELQSLVTMESGVILEDNNGLYWIYGWANGLTNNGTKASTGTALGDANGYTVALSGSEPVMPYNILLATFTALVNV